MNSSPKKESGTTGRKQRLVDSSAAPFPYQAPCLRICAEIKQRVSIPWLWRYRNLPGDPIPGRRCRSPFYHDKNPDFFISRDGDYPFLFFVGGDLTIRCSQPPAAAMTVIEIKPHWCGFSDCLTTCGACLLASSCVLTF
jgi:hypothetical protein